MKKTDGVHMHFRPDRIWVLPILLIAILSGVFGWTGYARAEGSRSLYPASYPTVCGTGAGQGCRADLDLEYNLAPYVGQVTRSTFLYVYAQATEYIVLGSSNRSNGGDIYVYDPQNFGVPGAETYNGGNTGTPDFTCSGGSAQPGTHYFGGTLGTITSRAQELAGPRSADNTVRPANAFRPCAYQAPVTGIYGVLFNVATTGTFNANPTGSVATPAAEGVGVAAWDVTVRSSRTSTADINGRLFTYAFIGFTGNNSLPIYSSLYYVTRDGYRYQQDLDGMDGNGYALYSNSLGFLDSGQPLYKDIRGNDSQVSTQLPLGVTTQTAENPTFFNDISPSGANAAQVNTVLSLLNIPLVPPSPTVTNVDFIGNVTGSTSYLGTGGTFTFDTSYTITYQIVVSLDGINFDPANANNKTLTGLAPAGSHTVVWDGTNNSGANFPAGGPYPFQVSGRNGEVHFPMVDVENNYFGGPTITRLNGTGAPSTTVYYDDRGYVLSSGLSVGTLNGILCPTPTPPQPVPAYSLVGTDSSTSYRTWGVLAGTNNTNFDCTSTNAWGDAKAVNLWTYYSYTPSNKTLSIIAVNVDAETTVTGPASAIAGNNVQGTFSFANNGTGTAHGLAYTMSLTAGLGIVTFGNLPTGATAAYNNGTGTVTFTGFPATLVAGAAVTGATAGAPITYRYTAPAASVTVNTGITTTDTDGVPANNNDSVTTYIGTVDVMTSASVLSIAAPGATVSGNILFANNGANDAAGVTYSATIGNSSFYPVLISFTSVPTGVTPSYNSSTGMITFTGLPSTLGSAQSFNIGFSYIAPSSGTIPVTSSITTTSTDINLSNNNSTASTVIGPDLTITKSRTGNFYVGQIGAQYKITVSNVGGASNGTLVTMTDTLPAGLTATGIAGAGWACVLGTLTCTRTDVLAAGASYPVITLTVNVTAATGTVLTNQVSVSGGGDINPANNSATDQATVSAAAPNLSIAKSHSGNFTQGQTGATYTITVTNVGTASKASGNTVTVTDTLPAGLTATGIAGTGWTCILATLTCTRTDILNAGSSYPNITLTVTVTATASSPLINTVSVTDAVASDTYTPDKTATDSTIVLTTLPDLTITKTDSSNFYLGATGVTYTITVTNSGNASKTAGNTVTVTDTLPSGLTATAISGTGWTCVLGTLTCTRNDALTAGSSYPAITLTVNISNSAPYSLTNTATVGITGQGEANTSNNIAQDTTTIAPTFVSLSDFRAFEQGGRVYVRWETASELNTLGFNLLRQDPATGKYKAVNSGLMPGIFKPHRGGMYTLEDRGASSRGTYTYMLIEVENTGRQLSYGPYTVLVESNSGDETVKAGSSGYERRVNVDNKTHQARVKAGKAARIAARAGRKNASGDLIELSVTENGVYYVDAGDISSLLGLSPDKVSNMISHGNLSLSSQGKEVAYMPAANNAGIYFYGTGIDSVYAKENIYWLERGKGAIMTVLRGRGPGPSPEGESFTDTQHFEQNLVSFEQLFDDPNADYWFWGQLFASSFWLDPPMDLTFDAPGVSGSQNNATIQLHLFGGSDAGVSNDHHVLVSLNGEQMAEERWSGLAPYTVTFTAPVNAGANTLTVEGKADANVSYSIVFINSFDVTYHRLYEASGGRLSFRGDGNRPVTVEGFTSPDIMVFDVTDPLMPKLNSATSVEPDTTGYMVSFNPAAAATPYFAVTGSEIQRVSGKAVSAFTLSSKNNAADYIIIAPAGLIPTAQVLADYRKTQGYKTMVVDIEDIMDEFNYGIQSPEAIKKFLSYAYSNWRKAPRYVVLVGDGSIDYKDNLGSGGCLIPSRLVSTPYGLFASDNYLADVNGDHVPEISIGRLPVTTSDDLLTVIKKIKTYESAPVNKNVILVADTFDPAAGDFIADSEALAKVFPAKKYALNRIYLSDPANVDAARSAFFTAINSGAAFFNYVGHSSSNLLSNSWFLYHYPDYGLDDLPLFTNAGTLPVMTAMACLVGNFADPYQIILTEALLLKADGGVAATWAPTGLSDDGPAAILDQEFYKAYVLAGGKVAIGDVVRLALSAYKSKGASLFMMDIYNILGDPALKMR